MWNVEVGYSIRFLNTVKIDYSGNSFSDTGYKKDLRILKIIGYSDIYLQ